MVLVSYSNPHKSEVIKCWKAVVCSLSSFLLASRSLLISGRFSSRKLMAQILVIMLREKWMLSTSPLQRHHWSKVGWVCVTPCLELLKQHGLSSKVFSLSHWEITDLGWQSVLNSVFLEREVAAGGFSEYYVVSCGARKPVVAMGAPRALASWAAGAGKWGRSPGPVSGSGDAGWEPFSCYL